MGVTAEPLAAFELGITCPSSSLDSESLSMADEDDGIDRFRSATRVSGHAALAEDINGMLVVD